MRVLLIDVNAQRSSTGHIVHELYNALCRQGHEALVCYARGESDYGAYKFGVDIEINLHALLTRISGLTDCFSPLSTHRLIARIEEFKPDIIHMHELHSYFLNSRQFFNYLKSKQIKILWTMHCDIAYTGRCGVALNCNKYKESCGNCPRLNEYPKTLFFDFSKYMLAKKQKLYQNLDFNICVPSRWLADRIKGSIVSNKPISVCANGIDDVFFDTEPSDIYRKMGIEGATVLFATPKLVDSNKGFDRLMSIAQKQQNINFVVLAKDYKGRAKLYKNLWCIGGIDKPGLVAEYMASASCFLMLSEYESFSLTIAQALATGTQVLAYKSGAPETIYKAPYVQFVDFNDEKALILLLKHCINNTIDRQNLRSYARQFAMSAMCDRYIEEYKCLLEN